MKFAATLIIAVAMLFLGTAQESQAQFYRGGSGFSVGFGSGFGGYGGGFNRGGFGGFNSFNRGGFNSFNRGFGGGGFGYSSYRPVYSGGRSFYGGGRSYYGGRGGCGY